MFPLTYPKKKKKQGPKKRPSESLVIAKDHAKPPNALAMKKVCSASSTVSAKIAATVT